VSLGRVSPTYGSGEALGRFRGNSRAVFQHGLTRAVFGPATWRDMQHGERFFAAGRRAAQTGLAQLAMFARPSRTLV
jgi:hypothetical protein